MTSGHQQNLQRFYLHHPAGHHAYVVVVDSGRRPFDFSDDRFKPAGELGNLRDACIYATGRPEERADHGHSYSVEFDLGRLLAGSNAEAIPAEGSVVSVHWLVQVGDEPDVKVDLQRDSCRLRVVSGEFEPVDTSSRDLLDENTAFEKRARFEKDYGEFVSRETESQEERRLRLAEAVQAGDVGQTLRVVAEDLCYWGGNLKKHMLHQVVHLAKDPFFVASRDVPEGASFRVFETWIVRDWIGSHEAFDLLEFHRSPEYARSFSARLDRLHNARVEFSKALAEYTVRTHGEDLEGMLALDEMRKDLKHRALWLAEHVNRIATQCDATKPSSLDRSQAQDAGAPNEQRSASDPQPFDGGEIVFYADRVELCGVDICSGPRASSKRIVLELLSQKRNDGTFIAYSGEQLENQVKERGGRGSAAGVIRDLRAHITARLETEANLVSEQDDVILSGGPGYRFAECISVRYADQSAITDITDIDEPEDVPNVPDDDVRDAFDVPDDAATRRDWILEQLTAGVQLKSPAVAEHFKCSVKTAQRDLTALKDEEKIEYVGTRRTGHYRLRQSPDNAQ